MSKGMARGYLFQHAFLFIQRHWGQDGLKSFSKGQDDYLNERWYPLDEFCEFLISINERFEKDNLISKLGFESVINDIRWKSIFCSRDPAELFMTTKNQDKEFLCGTFEFQLIGQNIVIINFHPHIENEEKAKLWNQYYCGRLQGVLKCSERNGKVEFESNNDSLESVFRIRWS